MYFSHHLAAENGEPILIKQTLLAPTVTSYSESSTWHWGQKQITTTMLCCSLLTVSLQRLCSASSLWFFLAKISPVFPVGLPNNLASSHQKLRGDLYKQEQPPDIPNSTLKIHRNGNSFCINLWVGPSSPAPGTVVSILLDSQETYQRKYLLILSNQKMA